GANLAYGFEGPGFKLARALESSGVRQRFVALAHAGAFGPGPDLTSAWQAWILTDGMETLHSNSALLADAMSRAGFLLGPDLLYSPDLAVHGTPKCEPPAPALDACSPVPHR